MNPFPLCDVLGMQLACATSGAVLDHVFDSLADGQGGWIVTANLDFLRRHVRDSAVRSLYAQAEVVVADGMPLVWAARLQGDHLPERVAGSSLLWSIAARAASERRSLYFLGGDPDVNQKAISVLRQRWPALTIVGTSSPMVQSPPTPAQLAALKDDVAGARPDILLVAMGSPKQEQVIRALRPALPGCWMIGVGGSFSFVAGTQSRAPLWMQQAGLEWTWRLAHEPRRLARRYLIDDLPFSVELFVRTAIRRLGSPPSTAAGKLPQR